MIPLLYVSTIACTAAIIVVLHFSGFKKQSLHQLYLGWFLFLTVGFTAAREYQAGVWFGVSAAYYLVRVLFQ